MGKGFLKFLLTLTKRLAAHFDAIARLEFWILCVSGFDVLEVVPHCHQTAISAFTGDLDDVCLTRSSAGGQDGLQQSDALRERLLSGMINPSADVIKLFGPA